MSVITGQAVTAYPLPDEELSPTSKNAVSNEAVCEGLDEIKNTLTQLDGRLDTAENDIDNIETTLSGRGVTRFGTTEANTDAKEFSFTANKYDLIIVTYGYVGYTADSTIIPLKTNPAAPISGSKGTVGTKCSFWFDYQNGAAATKIYMQSTDSNFRATAFGIIL